MPSPATKK